MLSLNLRIEQPLIGYTPTSMSVQEQKDAILHRFDRDTQIARLLNQLKKEDRAPSKEEMHIVRTLNEEERKARQLEEARGGFTISNKNITHKDLKSFVQRFPNSAVAIGLMILGK